MFSANSKKIMIDKLDTKSSKNVSVNQSEQKSLSIEIPRVDESSALFRFYLTTIYNR